MKKFVFLTISLFFITMGAMAEKTTITKFEGETIRGLIVSGAFDVRLSQGDECSVRVELQADASSKLTIELTDQGYVRIGYGSEFGKYFTSSKNRPVAHVVVKELAYLNISGTCALIAKEQFTAPDKFVMSVWGSAFCEFIDVMCKNGNVSVDGTAKVESLKITDSGKLTLEAATTARVELSGSASSARFTVSNAASVDLLKFMCPEIQASATGTSLIKANVTGTADVTVGGLAAFKYIGSGRILGSGAKPL